MAFKFEFPVKLPRFTRDEFELKKQEHTAKYGYEVHIPGFRDIFKWGVTPEPNAQELAFYKAKNVAALGERRYHEIKTLMEEKKETFLRMLSSPAPRIVRNAASVLTFLDDINDVLGTIGVVGRILARRMPSQLAKLFLGPAGWAFAAADTVNIMMELSRLPWKARRLQHELHRTIMDHPFSKKGRLRTLNKLKRVGISKGEIIEALQTTDNVFGFGLCLGPLVGLTYDLPSGLYRHIRGEKVTIYGLPAPLLWFDRVWSRGIKSLSQLWMTNPDIDDRTLGKSMVAMNLCTQMAKSAVGDISPLDLADSFEGIEIPAPYPAHPSTVSVIESEVSSVEEYSGWLCTDKKWTAPEDIWNEGRETIQGNLDAWWDRNRHDTESMVCSQNAVEAGQNTLAILEGDENVEYDYAVTPLSMLKLLNQDYRFPPDVTPAQVAKLADALQPYTDANLHLDAPEILAIARDICGFEFTTEVPARNTVPYSLLSEKYDSAVYRLQRWYFKSCMKCLENIYGRAGRYDPHFIPGWKEEVIQKKAWLDLNGWEKAQLTSYTKWWTVELRKFYSPCLPSKS